MHDFLIIFKAANGLLYAAQVEAPDKARALKEFCDKFPIVVNEAIEIQISKGRFAK